MKTRRLISLRSVLLAAGLFSGLALSPRATLHAQGTAAPPEVVCPANLFLSPTGVYSKATIPDIVWTNTNVRCRVFKIEIPGSSLVPPAAGSPPQVQLVDCTARLELSNNGGASYQAVTLPGTAVVQIGPNSGGQFFDTEMLALNLPVTGAVMIRESPTLQSTGRHTVRAVPDGSFRVSSFFEIFTEISLDGGKSWSPAAAEVRCALSEPGECATTSNLLPSGECVTVCPTDIAFANGIVMRDVRLRKPSNSLPPPPPGGTQEVSLSWNASGQISTNGGASFTGWAGACSGNCRYTSHLDSGGVRFFDTEMLALNLSGGGLPASTMIRESPSKQSLGRTSVRQAPDGRQRIGSFFDVFLEVSLDGGATWSPSTGSPSVFKGELVGLEPVAYVWPTADPLPAGDYTMPKSSPMGSRSVVSVGAWSRAGQSQTAQSEAGS